MNKGGGSRSPPTEIIKKLDCKWCNKLFWSFICELKKTFNIFLLLFYLGIPSNSGIRSNFGFSGAVDSYDLPG